MPLRALTSPSGPDRPPHAGVSRRAAETASAPPLQLPLSGSPQSRQQPGVGQSPSGTSHAAATPQPISAVHFTSEAARAASQTTELRPRPPANGKRRRQRFAPPGSACDSKRISGGEGPAARKPSVHQSRGSFPVLTNGLREGLTWLPV